MFRKLKRPQYRFKTYKSDAAPFFFFIDVFPPNMDQFDNIRSSFLVNQIKNNPIMPLPMRVDRVSNGATSILIRPIEPIVFPISDSDSAIINPIPFLQLAFKKLLFFSEIRSFENFYRSLDQKKVARWWNSSRFLYGNLSQIEEDFSAFLRAYLHTVVKAHINGEDVNGAAIEYCEIINKICKDRLLKNTIMVELNKKQENVSLFKEKKNKYRVKRKIIEKTEYYPELIDIEVFDLYENGFSFEGNFKDMISTNSKGNVLKYIPLLFYDDLQECMLQNLKLLETNEVELLYPSYLLDKNVILIQKSEDLHEQELNKYSWLNKFSDIDIGRIYNSLTESLKLLNKKMQTGNI